MHSSGLEQPGNYRVEDAAGDAAVVGVTTFLGNRSAVLQIERALNGTFTVRAENLADESGNPIDNGGTVTGWVSNVLLTAADIGGPLPAGGVLACFDGEGEIMVMAGGKDFGGGDDQFTYLYSPRTNDFDVQVCLTEMTYVGDHGSKAGIVVRRSLGVNSRTYMLFAYPTEGNNTFGARIRHPGQHGRDSDVPFRQVNVWPAWMRVKRSGVFFTAYTSTNGVVWEQFGRPQYAPDFPAELLVGLGTTSHKNGTATTARYRDFRDTRVNSNVVINISQQPTNTTVQENNTATFAVTADVTGAPELRYQWQAETAPHSGEFTNVHFATHPTYSTPSLAAGSSGTGFRVILDVSGNPVVTSAVGRVTLTSDSTAPKILSARGLRTLRHVVIGFSEPLYPFLPENPDLYSISGGFTVTRAVLNAEGNQVTLTLDGFQTPGTLYQLTVSDLIDLAENPIATVTVPCPAMEAHPGFVFKEYYLNIDGSTLQYLRNSPKFPDAPDFANYAASLEVYPEGDGENGLVDLNYYGARMTGFLRPPMDGNYHFFIAGDDECEFRLSTDGSPGNLVLLCREPQWSSSHDWTSSLNRPGLENRSATLFPAGIPLVAGHLYYFETLMKEGWGGDFVGVTWQLPGQSSLPTNGSPPISGDYLSGLLDPAGVRVEIHEQPQDISMTPRYEGGTNTTTIFSPDFNVGDGGLAAVTPNAFAGAWRYDPATEAWRADGQYEESPFVLTSRLRTPPLVITRSGSVRLTFSHRYSFEFNVFSPNENVPWDAGNIRISVNGRPYKLVPAAAFLVNGYNGVNEGGSVIAGQPAFTAESFFYAEGQRISSVADLGLFFAGDTVKIEFTYGADANVSGPAPNWEIGNLSVTEGHHTEVPVMFSVDATTFVPGYPAQPLNFFWERNDGSGFVALPGENSSELKFTPHYSDNGAQIRCILTAPGLSVTSRVARLSIPRPRLTIRQEGTRLAIAWGGPGTLQQALTATGSWSSVIGPNNGVYTPLPSGQRRFYRVRDP